jgi:hypothetical protein
LVHLVGFIIRKFVTIHGHMNVNIETLGYYVHTLEQPYALLYHLTILHELYLSLQLPSTQMFTGF